MKSIKDVLASVQGKDADEMARVITAYYADKSRKKTVEDARRDIRNKCFKDCKKLTKTQQEVFIYEFLKENYGFFNNNWLRKHHPDLFE